MIDVASNATSANFQARDIAWPDSKIALVEDMHFLLTCLVQACIPSVLKQAVETPLAHRRTCRANASSTTRVDDVLSIHIRNFIGTRKHTSHLIS